MVRTPSKGNTMFKNRKLEVRIVKDDARGDKV